MTSHDGKLGAWRDGVSSLADQSDSSRGQDGSPDRDHAAAAFQASVLAPLRAQVPDLAARWQAQARNVALLEQPDPLIADDLYAAPELVYALVGSQETQDEEPEETIITHGLRFGTVAFERGVSLHHTVKALDLLLSMTLYAVETMLDDGTFSTYSAADGIRIARHFQRRSALLSLAATRGYTQAYTETLRERFRHLRHDLRNPLGTITNVLSLMDDESLPLEARANPSFRAMATRNARSLEHLIADRLSDAAALLQVVVSHDVSLRTIACAVRRELRDEMARREVSILVDPDGPRGLVDSPGLELLLRGTLEAVLHECDAGDQLHLEFGDSGAEQATIILSVYSGRSPICDDETIERLTTMARRMGATISVGSRVLVSVPMQSNEDAQAPTSRDRALVKNPATLGDRDARHDLRSASKGQHG